MNFAINLDFCAKGVKWRDEGASVALVSVCATALTRKQFLGMLLFELISTQNRPIQHPAHMRMRPLNTLPSHTDKLLDNLYRTRVKCRLPAISRPASRRHKPITGDLARLVFQHPLSVPDPEQCTEPLVFVEAVVVELSGEKSQTSHAVFGGSDLGS